MRPKIINGGQFSDHRGRLSFNNDFDASQVKRIYCIENRDLDFKRGWQGHRIEQRWFCAINGSFQIELIRIDDWEKPSNGLVKDSYVVSSETMDILYVPAGYITCLQAREDLSKLLVMADYPIGNSNDEYRFDQNYFNRIEEESIL